MPLTRTATSSLKRPVSTRTATITSMPIQAPAATMWATRVARRHARLSGSRLDPGRHDVRVTVKAVTYHALEVRQTATGWHARVILDV